MLHADDGLRFREVPMLKGEKFLPLVQTEGCDPLTERLNMAFDEVFGCSQGRVGLNLAWRRDISVDTCPDVVTLLPLPQPPVRARTDARTNPSAQRATQLRSVLARVYAVSIQNQITTTVP
jgi:hypothetical protein